MPVLYAYDLETLNWDKPVCAAFVGDGGARWAHYGDECYSALVSEMQRRGGQWVAHAGGRFDLLLLLPFFDRKPDEVIVTGTTILAARWRKSSGGRPLTVRDSFPWFLSSLAKIGDAIGHPKKDVDRGAIKNLTRREVLEYCLDDCDILYEACEIARDYLESQNARAAWTAGGSAVSLLRAIEPDTWRAAEHLSSPINSIIDATGYIRGGRVECWARGRRAPVYSYDLKSSYPSQYAFRPVGFGLREAQKSDENAPHGVWLCRWYWPYRDRIPPAVDQGTQAGVGHCEAPLIDDEIAAFESQGIRVEKLSGWVPLKMINAGARFVREMYAQKESRNGKMRFCAKVFLNSLHGKFGENPIKDAWRTGGKPEDWYREPPTLRGDFWSFKTLSETPDGMGLPHMQPIAAAQILGRARVVLWVMFHAIQKAGGRVYYCDTDSVHTDLPPEKMQKIIRGRPGVKGGLGSDLGQWELESGPCEGIYVGPKSYILRNLETGEIEKAACKGVPWHSLEKGIVRDDVSPPLYRQARDDENGADIRWSFFETASNGAAVAQMGGITTFVSGVDKGEWKKRVKTRTIRPTTRGRAIAPNGDWRYLTPSEIRSGLSPDSFSL